MIFREITYNNFEISLVVFMPNITTTHAITYTHFGRNFIRKETVIDIQGDDFCTAF